MALSEATQAYMFCTIFFLVGFNSGYPSTFFPVFAQDHGYNLSMVGIFVSNYSFFGCLASFCGGWFVSKIGSRAVLGIGVLGAFATNLLLALLYFWVDSPFFMYLCILCRGFIGWGASFIYIVGYSFSLKTENTTKYVVMFETVYGVGIAFGPVFSANVYNFFGYPAAFATLGCLGLMLFPIIFFFELEDEEHEVVVEDTPAIISADYVKTVNLQGIMKRGPVIFVAYLIVVAWCAMFWLQPVWQPYVSYIGGGSAQVQLAFACLSFGYLAGGPSLLVVSQYLAIHNIMGLGMLFIGVAYLFLWMNNILVEIIASFVIGFGCAFLSMPTIQMTDLMLPAYYDAHVAISSLFSMFSYIGGFLGPTIAAAVYDMNPTANFFAMAVISLTTFCLWYACLPKYRAPKTEEEKATEKTPLISSIARKSLTGAMVAPSPAGTSVLATSSGVPRGADQFELTDLKQV